MNISNYLKTNKQTGFTLVELMVGLVIGLIATLVIMQVFSVFEGQKRTTTGTADAQTNGSIGLYSIQREVQMAGFGLPIFDGDPANLTTKNNTALNCSAATTTIDHDKNAVTAEIDFFPIVITDGGAGGSDTIIVRYGNATNGGIPTPVSGVASPTLGVDNTLGCQNDDVALFIDGTNCVSARVVDADLDTDTTHITLDRTAHGGVNMATVITANSKLACLGQYDQIEFAVNANNELTRRDRNGIAPVISDIVNIQAQYGVTAATNSNTVTSWVDTVSLANRNRIRAVRVAIVARNNLLERNAVTTACSAVNVANPTGLCAWAGTATSPAPAINLAAIGGANYRYRVYETIIPIRNITFSGALL